MTFIYGDVAVRWQARLEKNRRSYYAERCKVNAYETEAMEQQLKERGYEIVPFDEKADVYIINTCSVTNIADRKSRQMLHRAKKLNPESVVVAAGCYVQVASEELKKDASVDIVIGNNKKAELADILDEYLGNVHEKEEAEVFVTDLSHGSDYEALHLEQPSDHARAFIKVQDGCNQFCTYCIIPKIRGNYRSVPMEQLLAEAASLAEQGVKELILVAQETTLYGMDLYGKKSLHILLQELAKIKGIRWIRILYCYPEEIYPELIETIKNEKKVCHYLDMPIQHASDAILKRMGRRTTKAQLKETVSLLRKEIPDIVLRTTLIAGFPGETQEQHEELMEFVDEMEFERLGVFAYSPEENTPAASMPDQIPEEVKEERRDAILELQQEIAFDKAADMVGRTLYAMIEGKVADEPAYVARTYADSPDIDGYVFVNTGEMLMSGDFVKVKITGSAEYDLIGELV